MKKLLFILSSIVLMLIVSCSYPQSVDSEEEPLTQKEIKKIVDEKVAVKSKEIENSYLRYKILSAEGYSEKLEKIKIAAESSKKEADRVIRKFDTTCTILGAAIGFLVLILGFLGFKSFADFYKSQSELKDFSDKTMLTYRAIEEKIKRKEEELRTKYGFIEEGNQRALSDLDREIFMDYDHMLYFMNTYLPLTKNLDLYKRSLFKIGVFFMWDKRCERAILRFKEIERTDEAIKNQESMPAKILLGMITAVKSNWTNKRIMGKLTPEFFNAYGNAYLDCVKKKCGDSVESLKRYVRGMPDDEKEYIKKAINFYDKSVEVNPNFSKPYFNLGKIYSLFLEKDKEGINYYKQVFNKKPRVFGDPPSDIHLPAYRNIACCKVRLNKHKLSEKIVNDIIADLKNIPNNNLYWQKIIDDAELNPIKSTPQWRALIKDKFPSALI